MDHSFKLFIHFSIFHFRLGVTFGVKHQTFAIPNQIYLGNEWKVAPAGHNTMLLLFPWLMWSHCYSNDGLFDQPHNGVITVLEFSAYEIFKVQIWKVWKYGLWSFQTGYTKLERFLHKDQHTQRKILNFENWTDGEPQ